MNVYAYRETATGDYPLFEGDVRLRCPDIGDLFVCPEGYEPVYEAPFPEISSNAWDFRQGAPERVDGVLYQRFELYLKPAKLLPLPPIKSVMANLPIFPTPATGRIEVSTFGFLE